MILTAQAPINVICGLPDNAQVTILRLQPTILFAGSGSASFLEQLKRDRNWFMVWVGPAAPQQSVLQPGPIINFIADPDICSSALDCASRAARDVRRPWFNHPDRVRKTSRDGVSAALRQVAGLTMPKTIRCKPGDIDDLRRIIASHGLRYPILGRCVGEHGGRTLIRVQDSHDEQSLVACLCMDRELYLTEFVDFASADGLYRKYRVAMIGGKSHLISLVVAVDWNVHSASRIWNAATIAEERKALKTFGAGPSPMIRRALSDIYDILKLDYFGIDFTILADGSLVIFEANAVMNILGPTRMAPDIWKESGRRARAALLNLIDNPSRWCSYAA